MNYRNWDIYRRYYLPRVRKKLLDKYLQQLRDKSKPLFIHINRTAGSSIARSLGITEAHHTLAEYEAAYLEKFNKKLPIDIEVYTAIRNPFEKVVSQYFYRCATNQNKLADNPLEFNDWVIEAFEKKNENYRDRAIMFMPHVAWLEADELRNINYIRYENLEGDYTALAQKYQAGELVWKKRSEHRQYREYYNEYTKAIVAREFATDLEQFNYVF